MSPGSQVLSGKTAVVTGASRGIGAAIARRFAAEGAKVILVARTLLPNPGLAGSLTEVADEIASKGGECIAVSGDLAQPESLCETISRAVAELGGLDILVNNAAWARFHPISTVSASSVNLALQINVLSPIALIQLALPYMHAAGKGWILNISSAAASSPPSAPYDLSDRQVEFNRTRHPTVYGLSKAALDRMTTGWAAELAGSTISINSLAPVGAVASEGAIAVGGWDDRDHVERVEVMAEAALQLCHRPAAELSGRVARSVPLLAELGVQVRSLEGLTEHQHAVG